MENVNKFRKWSLALAEAFDAWRVIPRFLALAYGCLLGLITYKFLQFGIVEVVKCDAGVLKVLLDSKVNLELARSIACNVTDTLGPPTSYTVVLSTLVGGAAAVFGLYTSSGKDWSKAVMPWKWNKTNNEPVILNENKDVHL